MSYTEQLALSTRDCDLYGRWKPSAILEAMQETAIAQCESVGAGRSVTDALGLVWVLSRCRVELSRLPVIGEPFSLETYPMPPRHLFYPRAHVFRDGEGAVIGGAYGLWMLMDVQTRKTVRNALVAERLHVEDRKPVVGMPASVRSLGGEAAVDALVPRFTEFDINGHVNNTKYMDWCWNALGFDALADRAVAAFDVNYDREVRRGETIRTELTREGDSAVFIGSAAGQRCFGIKVALRKAIE